MIKNVFNELDRANRKCFFKNFICGSWTMKKVFYFSFQFENFVLIPGSKVITS